MKSLLRELTPPLLLDATRRWRNRNYGFFGDYASFREAEAEAAGYQSKQVVQAMSSRDVPQVTDKLIDERAQQVLSAIALVGASRPLPVLDFGGANGGYYHLLRPFLPLRWTVLETPGLAEANQHLASDELSFISDEKRLASGYNLVLMSGVLQYLPNPYETFARLGARAPFVIVNRAPLFDGAQDRLTVQRVHPSMYHGSYPAWFFARGPFMQRVAESHDVAMRWKVPGDTAVLDGRSLTYEGMLLATRSASAPPA